MYYFKVFDRWCILYGKPRISEHKSLSSAIVELLDNISFYIGHNYTLDKESEKASKKAIADKINGIFTDTNETPIVFTDGEFKYELYLIKEND